MVDHDSELEKNLHPENFKKPCWYCDALGFHICVECNKEISAEQCNATEGHCPDHAEENVFNFG